MVKKTLSIPKEMNDFLEENPTLSPSKMLQSKITEIKEARRFNSEEISSLKRQVNFITQKLWEANDNIDLWRNRYNEILEKKSNPVERVSGLSKGVSEA